MPKCYRADFLFCKGMKKLMVIFLYTLIIQLSLIDTSMGAGVMGNGADGSAVISGTVHLTGNMEYINLTVNGGSTLETHGYTIRVLGTLTNNGIITDSYSGGAGGSNGFGGIGGRFSSGHNPPQAGSAGFSGLPPSVSGAGFGGRGGGGGGGGGGAWDPTYGGDGRGGFGGAGGKGGQGGGLVTVYATSLLNFGTIHADGSAGINGNTGATGTKDNYTAIFISRDVAGGGGGGGAGGSGGNGGTVKIINLGISVGSIHAVGGAPGFGKSGGNGIGTSNSAGTFSHEENGAPGLGLFPKGGTGGRGEESSASSNSGSGGQNGSGGSTGSVTILSATICYPDLDGDGFGDASDPGVPSETACSIGFVLNNIDCDDSDPTVYPGAVELCDGKDNDCDGVIPASEIDNDGDGWTECAGDCDDSDPTVYLGAVELCDGKDNDCDGVIPASEIDNDGDGWTECAGDCDDGNVSVHPGAVEIPDNGVDEDCDGADAVTCYADSDADSYGSPVNMIVSSGGCPPGYVSDNTDCNDGNISVHPGAVEIPDNGVDEDCDGADAVTCYADSDADGYGSPVNMIASSGGCPPGYVSDNTDCNDGNASIHPGAVEILDDGVDQDCDGADATCCVARGDVNHDGTIGISDLTYIVDYLFNMGPAASCEIEADINTDGTIGISDLTYIVDYLFNSGPPPSGC